MKRITENELKARVNKLREYMAITEAEQSSVATGNTPPPPTVGKPKNPTLPASVPGSINNIAQGVTTPNAPMQGYTKTTPAAPAAPAAQKPPAASSLPKSVADLAAANGIKNPNMIQPGQQIKLPNGSTYTVAPGDNLSNISAGKFKGTPPAAPAAPTMTAADQEDADMGAAMKANAQAAKEKEIGANQDAEDQAMGAAMTANAAAAQQPPAAPAGMQAVGDDEGNTTITRPDGSSMVVGPDGKQIMPGSNPNLPQNKGVVNTVRNYMNNTGDFQKPGGFQGGPASAPAPAQQAPQPVKDGSGNNTNLTTNPNQPGGRPDYAGESTTFRNEESLARIIELARGR
jgi:LysM repeat protein